MKMMLLAIMLQIATTTTGIQNQLPRQERQPHALLGNSMIQPSIAVALPSIPSLSWCC